MSRRIVIAVIVFALACVGRAAGTAPTPIVPEAAPARAPSLFASIALGQASGSTDFYEARSPSFSLSAGGSVPVGAVAHVDFGVTIAFASCASRTGAPMVGDDLTLTTLAFTVAGRFGHVGRKVAVFGSAGGGFAYVGLGGFGYDAVYPESFESTWAPVVTVAGSIEGPVASRDRYFGELRYTWIEASLGASAGGSLNAGGASLGFGWRHVF